MVVLDVAWAPQKKNDTNVEREVHHMAERAMTIYHRAELVLRVNKFERAELVLRVY